MQRRMPACQASAIAVYFHMQRQGRACPGLDIVREMRQGERLERQGCTFTVQSPASLYSH